MNASLFITALAMGLTGSLHCAGMCGPVVLLMPFRQMAGVEKWLSIAMYHSGRILVYVTMGLVLYTFKAAITPQWQQYFSIVAGVALLIMGLLSLVGKSAIRLPWTGIIQQQWGKLMYRPSVATLLIAGVLNGLLPCGLVYMALSLSMAAGVWWQAALQMAAFGAGTVPMLVAITLAGQRLSFFRGRQLQRIIPVTMFLLAGLFMLRGMNLGIPYLSPKISIEKTEVKSSCCNKPN